MESLTATDGTTNLDEDECDREWCKCEGRVGGGEAPALDVPEPLPRAGDAAMAAPSWMLKLLGLGESTSMSRDAARALAVATLMGLGRPDCDCDWDWPSLRLDCCHVILMKRGAGGARRVVLEEGGTRRG